MTLTDAETAFADSAQGKVALAHAREGHRMREAHKGANAAAWTADHEATAIRQATAQKARDDLSSAHFRATSPGIIADARARADAAWDKARDDLNGWRNPGRAA